MSQLSQPSIKNIYKNIYNIFIINILGFLKMVDFWLTFGLLLVYFLDFQPVQKMHNLK